jgi:hypothetical protein
MGIEVIGSAELGARAHLFNPKEFAHEGRGMAIIAMLDRLIG